MDAFALNDDAPPSVLAYLKEAYYFVPLHLALALQSAGQYLAALDCFRTIYDYETQTGPPKVSAALTASSTDMHGIPRGTVTPYFRRISLP